MYNNQYPAVKLNRQKDTAGEKLKIGKCGGSNTKDMATKDSIYNMLKNGIYSRDRTLNSAGHKFVTRYQLL